MEISVIKQWLHGNGLVTVENILMKINRMDTKSSLLYLSNKGHNDTVKVSSHSRTYIAPNLLHPSPQENLDLDTGSVLG